MRVVDYHKDTSATPYQLIKGVGIVAGIFSLVVWVLLVANNLSVKRSDPIHSPGIQKLIEELKSDPKNEALRDEIRQLDMIARKAFFTSQRFNRLAIYLLVGGLVVTVIALKAMESYKALPPLPDSSDPKDDLVENAKWARKAVTYVGLVLVGFALMIALPWRSNLNLSEEALANVPATEGGGEAPKATAPAAASAAAPTPAPASAAAPAQPPASAEERLKNWPGLRGPAAGVATTASGLLTEWDGEAGTGVKWKTALPLPGMSSPIYWEGKLFLTGADETTREVYAVDAESGKLLWQKKVEGVSGSPAAPPEVSEETGYAAGTMATDGVRVFAIFSNGDLAAFDMDGNPVWSKSVGQPANPYGYASSLAIFEDTLLVQFDQEEGSYLGGFDVATGGEKWKTPREFGPSWSSPVVFDSGERSEVVLSADPTVVSYDPKDGKELWRVDALENGEIAALPVYGEGMVFSSADAAKLSAIDVKTGQVVWENEDLKPGVSSPVAHEGLLYCGTDDGALVCYDVKTGEEVWAEFADFGFYASPIVAEGRVYLMDRGGNMFVLKPGRSHEVVGMGKLGEEASTTPAVIGDSLYIRGTENLYRIAP